MCVGDLKIKFSGANSIRYTVDLSEDASFWRP